MTREVADLPHARGRTFSTLDEYLAYLRQTNGPVDLPYWREVTPGVYEEVTTVRRLEEEGGSGRVTREELERRFGFADAD